MEGGGGCFGCGVCVEGVWRRHEQTDAGGNRGLGKFHLCVGAKPPPPASRPPSRSLMMRLQILSAPACLPASTATGRGVGVGCVWGGGHDVSAETDLCFAPPTCSRCLSLTQRRRKDGASGGEAPLNLAELNLPSDLFFFSTLTPPLLCLLVEY